MQLHTYADGEDSTDSLSIFAIQHTVIYITLVVKYFQAKRPMFMQRVSKQDARLQNNTREAYLEGIIHTVQGALEPVAVQMQVEMAAEQQYKNLEPLYFGTSSDGITLRHLLPDVYEVCVCVYACLCVCV